MFGQMKKYILLKQTRTCVFWLKAKRIFWKNLRKLGHLRGLENGREL